MPVALARWWDFIAEASARFGIPVDWITRVMQAESAGQTHVAGRPIRSRAGAMGLMQLMPGTWAEMRAVHDLGSDPDDPRDNILAGTAYLRLMYDRFDYPGLFGAYNAGPARYAAYLNTKRVLPGETIAYVAQVTGGARASTKRPAPLSPSYSLLPVRPVVEAPAQHLFVVLRPGVARRSEELADRPAATGLFAIERTAR